MTSLADEFEALRPRLLRLAYSQLGSLAEAEDVVQEAWLRLQRTDRSTIDDLRAWLTTVVSRLGLDALGSARARREQYVGPWLPDPLVDVPATDADPADRVTLDESVSLALLFVLERLSPAERTAFILHDVFAFSFDEIAAVVGRTPQATRQLASRARRHVVDARPRQPGTPAQQRRLVQAFAAAAAEGDVDGLLEVLDPDVVMRADGGGRVKAARKPIAGADRVARAVVALARKELRGADLRVVEVNGLPGLLVVGRDPARVGVAAFTVDGGRITSIHNHLNPDKLRHVAAGDAGCSVVTIL
ncbi:MAG: polymerase sigma-70 factor, subfamily [Solirubrobacteraceae bacterium]|jgi:RNA polymerase sigma-70 factor (ECF subfamily)|nr:polymerase sigma-70 factor, subfamily [Solirubrobacteraceae bacterium]